MAKICLSLTSNTLSGNLEILDKYRKYTDLAELRVDCLDPDERFSIRYFPEKAGLPVILTVRRVIDGGNYSGGEGGRISILARGLAYAEANKRLNFSYVELEEDVDAPSLEEVSRAFGTRIIRSYYNTEGTGSDLAGKIHRLKNLGDEISKIVVKPNDLEDLAEIYRAAAQTSDEEKIILCHGEYSANTRILAEHLGSLFCYADAKSDGETIPSANGQLDPEELEETYHFKNITKSTKIFGLTGYPLKVMDSPQFFNKVFNIEKIDAVYIPFPADSIASMIQLAEELGMAGISVTFPYKEAILPFLAWESERVKSIGASNTLVRGESGWMGYNTDARGFSESLLNFSGLKSFKGKKITIIGSGGAARAIASEVSSLKGKALILNRTVLKARDLASMYKFAWGGLDSQGFEMMKKYSDIIIQTTPVGMAPDSDADLIDYYQFTGREMVMDIIYRPDKTNCLGKAEKAGCKILNGYDMLLRQARIQYKFFTGKDFPPSLIDRVGFRKPV